MKFFFVFLFFFVFSEVALQRDNRTVTIAVVEFKPTTDTSLKADARVTANVDRYVEFIEKNDTKLDMIIFPEDTLRNTPRTSVEVTIGDTPCDSSDSPALMRRLSCAARNSAAYLVVNLVEKQKCNSSVDRQSENCQKYGYFYHNTDAIFDRNGQIINRYRKYNLFGEYELDKPSTAEQVIVETDFGDKYGIFTCFDILFKSPAQDLLKNNVDGVIFPTMWFSELPFLTALQVQQMWAHAHDVRVFSAGANNPAVGSGGSGFYAGAQGMILGDIIATGGSQRYIYKYVPGEAPADYNPQPPATGKTVDELAAEMDGFRLTADPSLKEFESVVLQTPGTFSKRVCHKNGLCCDFTVETTQTETGTEKKSRYVYHLAAFSGVRSFNGTYNGGIETCAVLACLDSSIESCGRRFPNYDDVDWPITFGKISVLARFEKSENRTQFPNSLLSSIRPINASQTIWREKEVESGGKIYVEREFAVTHAQNRLLTFAIYGRNFEEDSPPRINISVQESSNYKSNQVSWVLMIVVVLLSTVAFKWS